MLMPGSSSKNTPKPKAAPGWKNKLPCFRPQQPEPEPDKENETETFEQGDRELLHRAR